MNEIIDLSNYKTVIISGDIHGNFKHLMHYIDKYEISNSVIIIAGDVGIGGLHNPDYYTQLYGEFMKYKLSNRNNVILAVRGNHDDPMYYNGSLRINEFRFKTVPDYSIVRTKDKNILCIGGAESIDKLDRIFENNEYIFNGSSKRVWWEGEMPLYNPELLNGDYDAVVTHTAPLGIFPGDKVGSDRDVLYKILNHENFNKNVTDWFYGHFHDSNVEYFQGIKFSLLNELEFKELK